MFHIADATGVPTFNALIKVEGEAEHAVHVGDWNVSAVTNMAEAFRNRTDFNDDISNWDVSKVTSMYAMFKSSSSFNQPIGDWNTSKVTKMREMFSHASSFNQPISKWNTSSVASMLALEREVLFTKRSEKFVTLDTFQSLMS